MPKPQTIIPIVEEQLNVETRTVPTGRVRVETKTEVVEELATAQLSSSDVEITRVPVGRAVETAPEVKTVGDVTIVPVMEEMLVVEKRLVLKEELHIRRRVATETVEVPVSLRKQRAIVTRDRAQPPTHKDKTNG
jgi:stress response protein YsnF